MFTTPEEFFDLSLQDDQRSRQRLLSETATESVWEQIIIKYPHLKRTITLNKTLPDGVLRILAKDTDHLVRTDIAMKRALPADIFILLAKDTDELVRARIAWNAKTPNSLLETLATDVSRIVAEPAKKRLAEK